MLCEDYAETMRKRVRGEGRGTRDEGRGEREEGREERGERREERREEIQAQLAPELP